MYIYFVLLTLAMYYSIRLGFCCVSNYCIMSHEQMCVFLADVHRCTLNPVALLSKGQEIWEELGLSICDCPFAGCTSLAWSKVTQSSTHCLMHKKNRNTFTTSAINLVAFDNLMQPCAWTGRWGHALPQQKMWHQMTHFLSTAAPLVPKLKY